MSLQDFLAEDPLNVTDDDIGEFLINVITRGLYIEPHIILREYIQNSHDAITAWGNTVEPGRIDIKIEPPNIHIIDNGPGMSQSELGSSMKKVGISSKSIGSASGFMGIGKLAGLSMAEKVYITSSKHGIPEKNRVVFYGSEMQQAIDERRKSGNSKPIAETLKKYIHLNHNPMPEPIETHYTAIHLMGVDEEYWKAINNREEFLKKLGLVVPVKQSPKFIYRNQVESFLQNLATEQYNPLEVYIDDVALYRPWYDEVQPPREIEVLNSSGDQIAYGWVCRHKESEQIPDVLLRGIALLQRGIAIGDRGLAEDLGLYAPNPLYFKWHIGEIYITNPNILLTANRMSMRRDEQANDFLQKVKQELRKISRAAAEFSQRDNASRKAPEHMKVIQEVQQKISDRSLNREMVPSTVKQLVTSSQDLKKRSRYLPDDIQVDVNYAIKIADQLVDQLTTPVQNAQITPLQTDLINNSIIEQLSEETILEMEEQREIASISERLGFSSKETLVLQTVVEAIADVSGGHDTKDFVRYFQGIEKALYRKFEHQP